MNMRWLRSTVVCYCLALLSLSSFAADEPKAYQLSLERPEAYGNYYAFKSEVHQTILQTESLNGQAQREDKRTVEASIVGTAWVSNDNGQGEIAEVVIYPNEYAGKVNGKEVQLTLGERLFVQMNDGELKVFSSAGHAMSPEVIKVLDLLLAFMMQPDESELSKDAMFALDQPRKPGRSWKGNSELLAASLNQIWGLSAKPDQIQSTFAFTKVIKLFDEEAANLDLEINLKGFTTPTLTERGLEIDESTAAIKVNRILPINKDSLNGNVSKQVDLSINASADEPEKGKVQVKRVIQLKSQAEYQIKN